MNATFNIKVTIDTNFVSTSFGSEKIEDMDTSLLASVLKVFGDVENKVKAQVSKFYGGTQNMPKNTTVAENTDSEEAPAAPSTTTDEDNKPAEEQ